MKTDKEMQIKILNKMIENIEKDYHLFKDIQYRNRVNLEWDDRVYDVGKYQFETLEMRVKPETIKVNGVDIPKPLGRDEILEDEVYYYVYNSEFLYEASNGEFIADHGIRFVYETKEEAIEASKLLFGLS